MARRRLAPDGTVANWKDIEIVSAENEEWSDYELDDGTELQAKSILSSVEKAVDTDGDPILDEDEEPYYRVQFDSSIKIVDLD